MKESKQKKKIKKVHPALAGKQNKISGKFNKTEAEKELFKQRWVRAQADYQNLQREIEDKKSTWIKQNKIEVLEEFIPMFDNFKKAFDHKDNLEELKDNAWNKWVEGIGFIKKQYEDVLKRFNIEEIHAEEGTVLDLELHEAVGEEETDEFDSNVVIKQVEQGYKMGDIVIRPAKVIISK